MYIIYIEVCSKKVGTQKLRPLKLGGGADFVIWIDYPIHIQNTIGDTRIGLVFSEDEKKPPYGDRQNRVI